MHLHFHHQTNSTQLAALPKRRPRAAFAVSAATILALAFSFLGSGAVANASTSRPSPNSSIAPAATILGLSAEAGAEPLSAAPGDLLPSAASFQLAATTPDFKIYFGPNCVTAGKYYYGFNAGEAWINDRFDSQAQGSDGYMQLIRNNAASVFVYHGTIRIYSEANLIFPYAEFSGQGCHNFTNATRNLNTSWTAQ